MIAKATRLEVKPSEFIFVALSVRSQALGDVESPAKLMVLFVEFEERTGLSVQ